MDHHHVAICPVASTMTIRHPSTISAQIILASTFIPVPHLRSPTRHVVYRKARAMARSARPESAHKKGLARRVTERLLYVNDRYKVAPRANREIPDASKPSRTAAELL
jgi:hypothetical protein